MTLTKSYDAFEGAVHFELYPYDTLRSTLLARKFIAAVPDHTTWLDDSLEMRWFNSMITVFAVIETLTVKLPKVDPPAELVGFKAWWDKSKLSTDYPAIWDGFLNLSEPVYIEWCEAYNSTRRRIVEAEPVLAIGAVQEAEASADFLEPAIFESAS